MKILIFSSQFPPEIGGAGGYVRGVRYLPITIAARSGDEAQNVRLLSQRHYSFRKSIRQRFFELEKK